MLAVDTEVALRNSRGKATAEGGGTRVPNKTSRSRGWALTILNYTEADLKPIATEETEYRVWQKEICPTTGTPHIHLCLYYKNARGFGPLQKRYPRAHIEIPINLQAWIEYCMKDDSREEGPWEEGERPQQGKRTDLHDVADAIVSGVDLKTIALASPHMYIKYNKGMEKLQQLVHNEDRRPGTLVCKWYWGESGVGKTRRAYEEGSLLGEVYFKDSSKWWDGYTGQKCVIIDDFDHERYDFRELLKLTDKWYPYQAECKGGYVKVSAVLIVITCEYPPFECYTHGNSAAQVERRMDEIIQISVASIA